MVGLLRRGIDGANVVRSTGPVSNADLMAAAGLAPVLEPSVATAQAVAAAAECALDHRRPAIDAAPREPIGMEATASTFPLA